MIFLWCIWQWSWHCGDGFRGRLSESRGKLIALGLHRGYDGVRVPRIHEDGLAVVVAADRLPRRRHELRPVEGVRADHALERFLRPHLVEDEISVRIRDHLAVIDLDGLVPVGMVPDHYVV